MKNIISCDPGVTGALAGFRDGQLTAVCDLPSIVQRTPTKGAALRDLIGGATEKVSRSLDVPEMVEIIRAIIAVGDQWVFVLEKVWVRPGQGIITSARLVQASGQVEGAAAACGLPCRKAEPSVWKRAMGLTANKSNSCERAIALFPTYRRHFRLKKHHNRAEAALLGLFAVRHMDL